jgi:hypothetical protein
MKFIKYLSVLMILFISLCGLLNMRMEEGSQGNSASAHSTTISTKQTHSSTKTESPTARPTIGAVTGLPEACKVANKTVYVNLKFKYCLAYPARFTSSELTNGDPSFVGPALDQSVEPITASLGIAVEKTPNHSTLDQVVTDFVAQYDGSTAPEIVQTGFKLGGEPAVLLEPVPGRGSTRDIILLHKGLTYHLVFFPSPKEFPRAGDDLEELFKTVTESFAFLQ